MIDKARAQYDAILLVANPTFEAGKVARQQAEAGLASLSATATTGTPQP